MVSRHGDPPGAPVEEHPEAGGGGPGEGGPQQQPGPGRGEGLGGDEPQAAADHRHHAGEAGPGRGRHQAHPARRVAAQAEGEAQPQLQPQHAALRLAAVRPGDGGAAEERGQQAHGAQRARGRQHPHGAAPQPGEGVRQRPRPGLQLVGAEDLAHVLPHVEDGVALRVVHGGRPQQQRGQHAQAGRGRHHLQPQPPAAPAQRPVLHHRGQAEAEPGPGVEDNLQVEPPLLEVLPDHDGVAGLHQADPQAQHQAVADDDLVRLAGEGGEEEAEGRHQRADEGAESGRVLAGEVRGEGGRGLGRARRPRHHQQPRHVARVEAQPGVGGGGDDVAPRQQQAAGQRVGQQGRGHHYPAPASLWVVPGDNTDHAVPHHAVCCYQSPRCRMQSLLRMATSAASSASYFTIPVSTVSWRGRLANTRLLKSTPFTAIMTLVTKY